MALLFGEQLTDRLIGRYPSLSQLDDRGDLIASLSPPALDRRVLQVAGGLRVLTHPWVSTRSLAGVSAQPMPE